MRIHAAARAPMRTTDEREPSDPTSIGVAVLSFLGEPRPSNAPSFGAAVAEVMARGLRGSAHERSPEPVDGPEERSSGLRERPSSVGRGPSNDDGLVAAVRSFAQARSICDAARRALDASPDLSSSPASGLEEALFGASIRAAAPERAPDVVLPEGFSSRDAIVPAVADAPPTPRALRDPSPLRARDAARDSARRAPPLRDRHASSLLENREPTSGERELGATSRDSGRREPRPGEPGPLRAARPETAAEPPARDSGEPISPLRPERPARAAKISQPGDTLPTLPIGLASMTAQPSRSEEPSAAPAAKASSDEDGSRHVSHANRVAVRIASDPSEDRGSRTSAHGTGRGRPRLPGLTGSASTHDEPRLRPVEDPPRDLLVRDLALPLPLEPVSAPEAPPPAAPQAETSVTREEPTFLATKVGVETAHARVELDHPSLGPLTVDVSRPEAGIVVDVSTRSLDAAMAIKTSEPALREELGNDRTSLRALRVRVRRDGTSTPVAAITRR